MLLRNPLIILTGKKLLKAVTQVSRMIPLLILVLILTIILYLTKLLIKKFLIHEKKKIEKTPQEK